MNQFYVPRIVYTFASQQAANQFLNNYKRTTADSDIIAPPQPVSGKKGNTTGLILLLFVAGFVMVYVYHANKESSKEDKQSPPVN
jgi:hypothetical protein